MQEFYQFLQRQMIWQALLGFVVGFILLLLNRDSWAIGWLWGCGTMLLYMGLLALRVRRCVGMTAKEAVKAMRRSVGSRLAFVAFSVILAFLTGVTFDKFAMIAGFLSWRCVGIIEFLRQRFVSKRTVYGEEGGE